MGHRPRHRRTGRRRARRPHPRHEPHPAPGDPALNPFPAYEVRRDPFVVSTDPDRLDLDRICAFLADAYWSRNRTRATIVRSIAHSLCFGLYDDQGRQVGFARVTTDFATVAYLGDVFVAPEARGQGLGIWLVEAILAHPELRGLRRWMLATQDAHGLYARFGFVPLSAPTRWMERFDPEANPPAP